MTAQRRLRRSEASEYIRSTWGLSYKANTLAKLATIGGGPLTNSSDVGRSIARLNSTSGSRIAFQRPKASTSS